MSARRVDVSAIQVFASLLAAVTGAVAASYLGVAGTIVGTALMSVASTFGAAVYRHFLAGSRDRLRAAASAHQQVTGQQPAATSKEAAATSRQAATTSRQAATTSRQAATTSRQAATTSRQAVTTGRQAVTTTAPAAAASDRKAGIGSLRLSDSENGRTSYLPLSHSENGRTADLRLTAANEGGRTGRADAAETEIMPAVHPAAAGGTGAGEHETQVLPVADITRAYRAGADATQVQHDGPADAAATQVQRDGPPDAAATRQDLPVGPATQSGGTARNPADPASYEPARPAGSLGDDGSSTQAEWPGGTNARTPRPGGSRARWLKLAGAAVAIFVVTLGGITAVEAIAGKPLSAVVWHRSGSGTTVGNLVGGQPTPSHHRSPAGVAPASPSTSPTSPAGSTSPTGSASPTAPTPSPTATSPPGATPTPSGTPSSSLGARNAPGASPAANSSG